MYATEWCWYMPACKQAVLLMIWLSTDHDVSSGSVYVFPFLSLAIICLSDCVRLCWCFFLIKTIHVFLSDVTPFRSVLDILNEKDGGDSELCLFAMTLLNKVCAALNMLYPPSCSWSYLLSPIIDSVTDYQWDTRSGYILRYYWFPWGAGYGIYCSKAYESKRCWPWPCNTAQYLWNGAEGGGWWWCS